MAVHDVAVVGLEIGDPAAGELHHRGVAAGLGEEPQGLDGEVVVLLVELVAPGAGQGEGLGWSSATSGAVHPGRSGLDGTLLDHVVEVTTHRCRCQVEPLRERGRRAGSVLEDRASHPVTRGGIADLGPRGGPRRNAHIPGSVEFHNIIVALMVGVFQLRPPLPPLGCACSHLCGDLSCGGAGPLPTLCRVSHSHTASDAGSPAVAVENLVMRYGDKAAVDGLTMTVERNSITAVLGPNGAGKTTTLETCEGYRTPHEGTVRVLGLDPRNQRRDLLPRIGVMLQSGGAWSGVRAVEMLRHIASLHSHPLDISMLVDRLGLDECGRTPYRRLSGGQQQRLALAMAVVGRPELIFVDEPTAGMDPQARRDTWELLEELRGDGVTIVLTTHYMDEAERLADQIHVIDRGRLVVSGTPSELTRGGGSSTIRLVLTKPFPPDAPASLQSALGANTVVQLINEHSLLITGPADASTLAKVSLWCEEHGVLPESLTLGQRTLEDVFLQITGRELTG